MEISERGERSIVEGRAGGATGLPRFVEWLVAGVVVLVGLAFVLGGSVLLLVADPDVIARLVAEGTVRSDVFAGAELVAVTYATAQWGGAGLVVAGLGIWVGAVAYVVRTRRAHRRRADGEPVRTVATNAVVGSVATVVLGFVPFSSVLGGLVAGYLERGGRDAGLEAGALSGLFVSLPAAVVLAFVAGGLVAPVTGAAGAAATALIAAVLVVSLLFAVLITVALGALGGLLGDRLARGPGETGAAEA